MAGPPPQTRFGAQYPSIWVTRGGGGTFSGVWTPDGAWVGTSGTAAEGTDREITPDDRFLVAASVDGISCTLVGSNGSRSMNNVRADRALRSSESAATTTITGVATSSQGTPWS